MASAASRSSRVCGQRVDPLLQLAHVLTRLDLRGTGGKRLELRAELRCGAGKLVESRVEIDGARWPDLRRLDPACKLLQPLGHRPAELFVIASDERGQRLVDRRDACLRRLCIGNAGGFELVERSAKVRDLL